MRTGTFADERVVDLLNEKFVVVWNNHNPDIAATGQQAGYSDAEIAAYPEGGGRGNVRNYFATPDGKPLLELQGYWSADTFLEEAKFALDLKPDTARDQINVRARDSRKLAEKLAAENAGEMSKPIKDSPIRRRIAAIGLLQEWYTVSVSRGETAIAVLLQQARDESSIREFV